jgi:patatin-like phospholipase/acyl hydrolase
VANLSSLSGIRIWLSGSIPDDADAEQKARLKAFAKALALSVFREGAQLIHGFHPSLAPTLLEAAREYREASTRRAPISLFVSAFYRESVTGGYDGRSVADLEADCELRQIPQATTSERSLEELRNALASEADVLIAIGGRWWESDRSRAGVPVEFLLALDRGIPSFLPGGLGGATAGYLEQHPEILRQLRNGLDAKANEALAASMDVNDVTRVLLNQIARLPLGRRETGSGQRFRILCLDGGGIRGAFTAAVLARWEEMSNLHAADHFDLIAGTSTGGILAIGLGLGLSAGEMVRFYREQGPAIFPLTGVFDRLLRGLANVVRAKFDARDLEKQLSLAYDRDGRVATLADSKQRLLITSYDLIGNALRLYRTNHHPSVKGHDHLRAGVVARATSAAPTYFKPAPVDDPIAPEEAVDGGVWANCPAMAALGEAVGVLKIPLNRIDMLSVGTAGMPTFVGDPAAQGLVGWGPKAPDLFMNSQMDATLCYVEQLIGKRFLRVDDDHARVQTMDRAEDLGYLFGRGAKIGEKYAGDVLPRFLNGVSAAPWRQV